MPVSYVNTLFTRQNYNFLAKFEKNPLEILLIQKIVLPLHPQKSNMAG